MIFWFSWDHPSSLNALRSTVGFNSPRWWAQSYLLPVRLITSFSRLNIYKSAYSTSNLSLKVRCVTSNLWWCFVWLKDVLSCESVVPSASDDSRGGPQVSRGKSTLVASICGCVWELLIKIILHTWKQRGSWEPEFVSVLNAFFLRTRLKGSVYFYHVPSSLQYSVWKSRDMNHCQVLCIYYHIVSIVIMVPTSKI